MKLKKYEQNPIFTALEGNAWEERCVLNPAVVYDEARRKFIMLYRAAGNDREHIIRLGLADSGDGVTFNRCSSEPIFQSRRDEADGGCVEDPRIVKIGDTYFMTYAARAFAPGQYWLPEASFPPICLGDNDVYSKDFPEMASKNITVTYLAATKDFIRYKRLGRLTEPNVDNRDVVLFPEKVGGKYVLVSRPKFRDVPEVKMPSVWISFGDDLLSYAKPQLLFTGREWWESARIGAGAPPIRTEEGWFMLYHGVDDKGVYRVGAVLMDLEHPERIIARTKNYIMEPEHEYETCGIYNGCVFPTGNVVKDGTLYVYYGSADQFINLATADFHELVRYLAEECRV